MRKNPDASFSAVAHAVDCPFRLHILDVIRSLCHSSYVQITPRSKMGIIESHD
jgi:hypothetical protein